VGDPWAAFERLPLTAAPKRTSALSNYADWLRHPDRDDFWRATAVNERYDSIDVPALHVAGWHDIFLKGSLENYVGLRDRAGSAHARSNQRLIVTPWGHFPPSDVVGELWLGSGADPTANPIPLDLQSVHLQFFD